MNYKIDTIDKKILKLLQVSSKYNTKEIASRIGLTITPTYERIKKLESEGIIKKYSIVVDWEKLGKELEAFCFVTLKAHSKKAIKKFEEEVQKIDDVVECYHITGNADYMLKVLIANTKEYQSFLVNKLSEIDNVGQVQTSFVMTKVVDEKIIKV